MNRLTTLTRLYGRRAGASRVITLVGVLLLTLLGGAIAVGTGRRADRGPVLAVASPRVVVLKTKRMLYLFDGEELVRSYAVDLGTNPLGTKLVRGDRRTPTGRFHVVTKNAQSPYHRFLGLDYPNTEAVERGLGQGLVSPGEAASIREALAVGRCPDWSTALGGGIGIHGRRRGEDWTAGCIALADEHIDEVFGVLRIGDPVEILP